MKPLVSVVVVNYNGHDLIGACVESLARQSYEPLEVLVVDNGSIDGSADVIGKRYPTVRVIRLTRNLGFAGGCNVGIRAARGEFIATLNNDAVADNDWIASLVETIQLLPNVGAVASKLLFLDEPDRINSAGICLDRLGIAWDRRGGDVDDDERGREVFGASAGAALYRRSLFDDIGLFDGDFFMYLEDVDFAWRARLANWRCRYVPGARVYHAYSATSGDQSPFKRYHLGRNKFWLIAKNYPAPYLWLLLPLILSYDFAGLCASLVPGRNQSVAPATELARWRGRIDGLLGLPRILKKRHLIQRNRRVSAGQAFAMLAPVSLPWQVGQRFSYLGARARRSRTD